MLESVQILEKFDFLLFTYDPIALTVQLKGSHSTEPKISLSRALSHYHRESRKELIHAVRERQREGNIILLSEDSSSGAIVRNVLMWRFDEATGKIVGIIQPLGTQYSFVNSCTEVAKSRDKEERKLWQAEVDTSTLRSSYSLTPKKVTSISSITPNERLVQLNVALEGARLGFWDWNKATNLLSVNQQWASLIGVRPQDIRSADDFFARIHPDDKESVEIALAHYAQGKTRMYRCKLRLQHAQGHYVPIEAFGAFQIRRNKAGVKQMHMVGIHRDRSEEVARERELEDMVEKAHEEMRAKARFLANVSHEIRTPIHGILNMVQFAKSYHTTQKQEEYLNYAIDSAKALGFKLDGLVDYANLDHMPLLPAYNKARLMPLFNLASGYCWNAMQEKNLAFEMDIDHKLSGVYDLDEKLMAQILLGLLDNATKFTSNGLVTLKARHMERNSRPDQPGQFVDRVQITITDTGIGMSDEQLLRVFLPYQQKQTGRTRSQTGVGVGLNLIHACIEALYGEVEVDSEPGFGTEVSITLNLRGYESDVQVQQAHFTHQTAIKKVLVVDDVELNRMIVRAELEHLGIEVEEAENGQMVLNLFENGAFETDLVLMDIQMPIMDGITATKKLREEVKTTVPIVGITADATRETERDGLEAGMNQVFFKPVDIATVLGSFSSGVANQTL